MKQRMTEEQFQERWAAKTGLPYELLKAAGWKTMPCDCGEQNCRGWRMVSSFDGGEETPSRLATFRTSAIKTAPYQVAYVIREDYDLSCRCWMAMMAEVKLVEIW